VLNGTARIATSAQSESVSTEKQPESSSNLKPGDVLISRATAVREHEIILLALWLSGTVGAGMLR